ncbi:alpha/beta hydrolase [Coraliomargarita sp. SDUM461004]|uniref:Alpha/beta hydrolase n=1 Tax=Thalassobacterium sedimentorum TaxID=3041258 RepID=A0ABU1AGT5_9BACT|nr:alpha/beta hydrolase [Coraliomargarita sp. SDUM461004]MDQ8193060.1 alpha/beta hydrolase [Coraliomargarita sp. SDUM461004]
MNTDPLHNGLPLTFPLWSENTPLAGEALPGLPRLTVYLPSEELRSGQAMITCPGGGYGHLSTPKEGHRIARFLSSHGHAAAVLENRYAPYQHPIPLLDAQRAIRTLRHYANEWSINPEQIGIMGFSAGGHLAGTAATLPQAQEGIVNDSIDQQSSRPDFAALIYPVVSLNTPCTHFGSRDNLLGADADPKLIEQLSLENAVNEQTPPTLLVHTNEDEGVPPENSILFYQALRKNKIPAELHIYEKEGHGIGLAKNHPWGRALLQWMSNRL